jgi:hypothetical protein
MFLRNIALTMFVAGLVSAQTTTTTTRDVTIGPIGVGSTETVQINVSNLAGNPTTGTAASCTGSVTFNNSAGNAIGTSTSFNLTAGQISSVSMPFNKLTTGTTRVEVIGVVALTTSSANRAPCSLHYSLETFDTATGASHVLVNGEAAPAGGLAPGRGGN